MSYFSWAELCPSTPKLPQCTPVCPSPPSSQMMELDKGWGAASLTCNAFSEGPCLGAHCVHMPTVALWPQPCPTVTTWGSLVPIFRPSNAAGQFCSHNRVKQDAVGL